MPFSDPQSPEQDDQQPQVQAILAKHVSTIVALQVDAKRERRNFADRTAKPPAICQDRHRRRKCARRFRSLMRPKASHPTHLRTPERIASPIANEYQSSTPSANTVCAPANFWANQLGEQFWNTLTALCPHHVCLFHLRLVRHNPTRTS